MCSLVGKYFMAKKTYLVLYSGHPTCAWPEDATKACGMHINQLNV